MIDLLALHPLLTGLAFTLAFGALLLGCTVLGVRVRRRRGAPSQDVPGTGVVEGAVFGLFGLLLAFSFSGAFERFQGRKQLLLHEAQAVGTAWSRLELLPEQDRAALQDLFRRYLDARLAAYDARTPTRVAELLPASATLGEAIAQRAAVPLRGVPDLAEAVMDPINEMLDVALARTVALRAHPPLAVHLLLLALALWGAYLVGLAMGTAPMVSRSHLLGFCALVALTLYVTFDLELPRLGLLRMDSSDQLLRDLRQGWG
jgi:hypothetical protein